MSWQYGLKYHNTRNTDESWYELAEIYDSKSYTFDSLIISGESPEEIIEMLEMVLNDLKNNLLIVEEIGEK